MTIMEERRDARRPRMDATKAWSVSVGSAPAMVLLSPLLLLGVVMVAYPLLRLLWISLTTGDGIGNYATILGSSAGRRSLITTVVAAILVSAASVAIGTIISWCLVTTRSRLLKVLLWISVLLPFWMGTVVKNYALILIMSRRGAMNQTLELLGLPPIELLFTPAAVVLGMIYSMIPYATVSVFAVMLTVDQSQIAAAQSMGASRARALKDVLIPLILPGLIASAALVFAIALGFYVTPVLLGGAQAPFMASYIQASLLTSYDLPVAAAASVLLLVTACLVLVATLRMVGRDRLQRALA